MSNERFLVVAGEGDGHDLVGLYLLTGEQADDAWSDVYSDVWEYICTINPPSFDNMANLIEEITKHNFVIKDTWVTPTY